MAKRKPKKPRKPAPKRKPKAEPRAKPKRAAAPPDPDALSLAEQRFLEHYLLTDNRTAAYQKAFPGCTYSTARSGGSTLLAKPNIKREVDAYRADQRRRFRVTAARVIAKRAELAFSDVGEVLDLTYGVPRLRDQKDIPAAARRSIKTVAQTAHGVRVTMQDQNAALKALELHLGLAREIPPLDALLAALPAPLAAAVRAALAGGGTPGPAAGEKCTTPGEAAGG